MTTKHIASLPYKVSTDCAPDAKRFHVVIRDANDWSVAYVTGTITESHLKANYIAHAANAYPRLVGHLKRVIHVAEIGGGTNHGDVEIARALLRELGEVE